MRLVVAVTGLALLTSCSSTVAGVGRADLGPPRGTSTATDPSTTAPSSTARPPTDDELEAALLSVEELLADGTEADGYIMWGTDDPFGVDRGEPVRGADCLSNFPDYGPLESAALRVSENDTAEVSEVLTVDDGSALALHPGELAAHLSEAACSVITYEEGTDQRTEIRHTVEEVSTIGADSLVVRFDLDIGFDDGGRDTFPFFVGVVRDEGYALEMTYVDYDGQAALDPFVDVLTRAYRRQHERLGS